jgi:hypothetical protein
LLLTFLRADHLVFVFVYDIRRKQDSIPKMLITGALQSGRFSRQLGISPTMLIQWDWRPK